MRSFHWQRLATRPAYKLARRAIAALALAVAPRAVLRDAAAARGDVERVLETMPDRGDGTRFGAGARPPGPAQPALRDQRTRFFGAPSPDRPGWPANLNDLLSDARWLRAVAEYNPRFGQLACASSADAPQP